MAAVIVGVVRGRQRHAMDDHPPVEHLHGALQRLIESSEERRVAVRQEHVDVNETVPGFGQETRQREFPSRRDDAFARSGGHAAALVQDAVDRRRADARQFCDLHETRGSLASWGSGRIRHGGLQVIRGSLSAVFHKARRLTINRQSSR